MQRRCFSALLALLLLMSITLSVFASTAPEPSKRFIALAVYVETPKQDWPGFSSLNDKIIETIVAKLNSLVVNQIISGSGVIDKLKEYGIESLDSVEPRRLASYGRQNNISYIVMFSLRTSDFSYSLKAFDVAKSSFLYDGASQTVQPQTASWSLSDFTISPTQLFMKKVAPALDGQLTALLQLIK